MFFFADRLRITALDLVLDARQRQARGFVSHGHYDHLAPHELAFCTPATARFYRRRLGGERLVKELPFGEPFAWDGCHLTTFPAGHILGSAMLLIEHDGPSLLYTGDFRLSAAATAEQAAPPHADWLVMECTFGAPQYRLPPRQQSIADLLGIVRQTLAAGLTPVVYAPVLGKAQEVTRLLTDAGWKVRQHPAIYALSCEYEAAGCPLGDVQPYGPLFEDPQSVLVFPPPGHRWGGPTLPRDAITIAVTGWAADAHYKFRLGVDYAIPLSDHADFDELLACVERVGPRQVYCWHGQETFPDELRRRGWDAYWLPTVRRPQPS